MLHFIQFCCGFIGMGLPFSTFSGLASFAGSICKKYNVELAGLMQYVTNQLKAGKRYVRFLF